MTSKDLDERIEETLEQLVDWDDENWRGDPKDTLKQLIRDVVDEVVPDKYHWKHKHDIQGDSESHYKCLQCLKTLDEINGNDGMGDCPHFRSFNQAIDQINENVKELGL